MIVDSSAIVAIMRGETEALTFTTSLKQNVKSFIAAPTSLEVSMVLLKDKAEDGIGKIDEVYRQLGISVIPFTAEMAVVATDAFLRYGKGRNHKAQLNFGDCISYAVSKVEMMPLLFKGEDFRKTDVECAI